LKRQTKILIIGSTLVSMVLLVAVFSQYTFIVAVVGDPFVSNKEAHNSLVIIRKIDTSQNLTGKIVVFWWNAQYMNLRSQVLGIDRVTNDNATILGMADETDEELRPRAKGYVVFRANITGEFVTFFTLP